MAIEATTPNGHVTLTQLDKLTDSIANKIFTKVDKEDGKGLSTNDFTDTLKTKLEDLDNATDEDINKINAKIAAGNSTDTGEIKFGMATSTADGLMSAEDKAKLDSLQNYTLPVATSDSLGGIKIGNGLEIDADGIVSVNSSSGSSGNVVHGEQLFVNDDVFTVPDGVSILYVSIQGAGGGGGGGGNYSSAEYLKAYTGGNNGNSGYFLGNVPILVNQQETYSIVVGQPGTGGKGYSTAGIGGAGRNKGANGATASQAGAGGGGGGSSSFGETIVQGGAGGEGGTYVSTTPPTPNVSGNYAGGAGGAGGAGSVSGGSNYTFSNLDLTSYGCGGAGGAARSSGGNGTAGYVYVRW